MILGPFGAWSASLRSLDDGAATQLATDLRDAGFATVWVPSGSDETLPARLGHLLSTVDDLAVASGILISWRHPAEEVDAWVRSLPESALDRLTLGIGVSHPEIAAIAGDRPVDQVRAYLSALRGFGWRDNAPTIVLGSLGPRMSSIAAELSDGVHPYLVPVSHTRRTRELIGPDAVLAPEQGVVIESDPAIARATAREHLAPYLTRTNYVRSWLRLGYTPDDVAGGGSDRLIDDLVAWGSLDDVVARVNAHREAGADHVAVQLLGYSAPTAHEAWSDLGAALRATISP